MKSDTRQIPLAKLIPFEKNPYKVRDDKDMRELMEIIRTCGVLSAATACLSVDGTYELISGHRSRAACKSFDFEAIPVVVQEQSDYEATVLVVEYDVLREHLLPSEKAFAYKLKIEAVKKTAGQPWWDN